MFMLPQFALLLRMAELTSFLPLFFLPPESSSFWGTSIATTPSGTQEVFPTPVGGKYSIGSSLLTSSLSTTLTYLHFYIAPLAVVPPLISLLLPSPSPSCSWKVLQDLGSNHLPILLTVPFSPVFRPNERTQSFNIQKACCDDFAFYFDSHCSSAEEYSSLFLSSEAALFTFLTLNAAKSFIPFDCIKCPPKAWWSAEVEEAVSERRKAFAAAHRSDKDRQAYIFASQRASSVISKTKAEASQATCSSLSPKSNPKSMYLLLRSVPGSSSLSSSSPNFPNCSSLRSLPIT